MLECLDTVACLDHRIGDLQLAERALDGHHIDFVIVDQQNGHCVVVQVLVSFHVKTKVVPRAGGALSTQIWPSWFCTFLFTIVSPIPLDSTSSRLARV